MSSIIALDPGIDGTGLAVFDLDLYNNRSNVHDVAAALIGVKTVRTEPDLPLPDRLHELGNAIRLATLQGRVEHVYVEQPAKTGSYQRNAGVGEKRMAAPMSKLYLSMGALIEAARAIGAQVTLVPAPRLAKIERAMLAKAIFAPSPAALVHRAAMPSADALDAIWLGAQQLTGPIAFDRRRAQAAGSGA